MKLDNIKKLKSLILSGVLTLSILFTGCSTLDQETGTNSYSSQNSESVSILENITNVPEGSVKATVERVVDGDTMKLKISDSGEVVTLRLLLVDTPESVKKGVDPQPYSIEASDYAKEVLKAGDTVYIEYDEGDKTDKYDRHLGYLWFYSNEDSNWEMYNEKIISKGYARVGFVYSQKRHLDRLSKAQDKAKDSKLNIWSVPGYVTNKGYDVDAYNSSSSKKHSSSSSSSKTVYANSGNSNSDKYHSSAHAHDMKSSTKMSEDEAKASGYVPCGLCY
ncbi:thermonuclease family protein [Romboutsia sp.]|uniref:thermonuclease family protein n=1 Tax=Romboutsia sp. TaxID=1965302 RepID=UPI003F31AEE2